MLDGTDWLWVAVVGGGALALLVALAFGASRLTGRRRPAGPPGREVGDSRNRG
jgi:hypothetical protein